MKDEAEQSNPSTGYPAVARRFVLLGGEDYYATGGFNDFISSHDTLESALKEARFRESAKRSDCVEWWHIWDCGTNSVVAKSDHQAYGASNDGPTLDGRVNG